MGMGVVVLLVLMRTLLAFDMVVWTMRDRYRACDWYACR